MTSGTSHQGKRASGKRKYNKPRRSISLIYFDILSENFNITYIYKDNNFIVVFIMPLSYIDII